MRVIGNLVLVGLGQIENLRVQNLALDPPAPSVGQIWYNTTNGVYKGWDGTAISTFSSGGNTDMLLSELDAVELSVGLDPAGALVPYSGTAYLNSATSLKGATVLLDSAVSSLGTSAGTTANAVTGLTGEVDAIELGSGLNANGTFTAPTGTTYLGGATSLKGASVLLDAQVALNTTAAAAASTNAAGRVSKTGDSLTGPLAFNGTGTVTGLTAPVLAGDAATKAYVDSAIGGLSWAPAVDEIAATNPTGKVSGYRVLNSTDSAIYTMGATVYGAGVVPLDGTAVMSRFDESGWVYSGSVWVQFTGSGQISAGLGLVKVGNVMDINLGAGINQSPTDAVGIDTLSTGGLITTVDGTTASTEELSKLAILLNGTSLQTTALGLSVKAGGVGIAELSAGVAGNGLTGGAGTSLAVGAGVGISVAVDAVALDLAYTDVRYIKSAGGNMTGLLGLVGDPVAALDAAPRQYVDALATKVAAGTFVYTGATAAISHTVIHNLGSQFNGVTVYDVANKVVIPENISADTINQLVVTFASAIACKVVVTGTKV